MKLKFDLPVRSFKNPAEFEQWMQKHYADEQGIWLKFYKKNSGIKSINYNEALDVALCYGWIDAQLKSFDDKAYLQRFTPRRKGSVWSKRNVEHIARLKKLGRMKPAGLAAVKSAQQSGAWDRAYESSSKMVVPKDFLRELNKNQKAKEFFATLNKANTYAIAWRIHNVKRPENRAKKIAELVKLLSMKQKLH